MGTIRKCQRSNEIKCYWTTIFPKSSTGIRVQAIINSKDGHNKYKLTFYVNLYYIYCNNHLILSCYSDLHLIINSYIYCLLFPKASLFINFKLHLNSQKCLWGTFEDMITCLNIKPSMYFSVRLYILINMKLDKPIALTSYENSW